VNKWKKLLRTTEPLCRILCTQKRIVAKSKGTANRNKGVQNTRKYLYRFLFRYNSLVKLRGNAEREREREKECEGEKQRTYGEKGQACSAIVVC